MSKLETIEADIRALPVEQAEQLQDWLSEYLEEGAELIPSSWKASNAARQT